MATSRVTAVVERPVGSVVIERPEARSTTVAKPDHSVDITTEAESVTEQVDYVARIVEIDRGQIGATGADGEKGDPGPPGVDTHRVTNFAVASTVWEDEHHLGFTPSVTLQLADGTVISGSIPYNGPDKTRAEFYFPVAGKMALS